MIWPPKGEKSNVIVMNPRGYRKDKKKDAYDVFWGKKNKHKHGKRRSKDVDIYTPYSGDFNDYLDEDNIRYGDESKLI